MVTPDSRDVQGLARPMQHADLLDHRSLPLRELPSVAGQDAGPGACRLVHPSHGRIIPSLAAVASSCLLAGASVPILKAWWY